jgi:hypothetical protein
MGVSDGRALLQRRGQNGWAEVVDETWPLALLLIRVIAVAVLYLFLVSAFGALRAELRGPRPQQDDARVPARAGSPARPSHALPSPVLPSPVLPAAASPEAAPLSAASPAADAPALRGPTGEAAMPPARRAIPPRPAIALAGLALMVALGSAAMFGWGAPEGETGTVDRPIPAGEPFGPPLRQPAPGRVTVGLAAVEASQVRVTVDGVVQFDGTLRPGERRSWEGVERIQVWTDTGRTLQLAVNGVNLGAYSPAMGHPDWNRIDFGFWPGWSR